MSCHIDMESIRTIRKALILGLSSYGEIERLLDRFETLQSTGEALSRDLKPIHPTGNTDTIAEFADALLYLDIFEGEVLEADMAQALEGGAA